jgi:hypothetical protein
VSATAAIKAVLDLCDETINANRTSLSVAAVRHAISEHVAVQQDNMVGDLQAMDSAEHLALLTGLSQVARGEDPTPNVATACIRVLARVAGVELVNQRPTGVVNLDAPRVEAAADYGPLDDLEAAMANDGLIVLPEATTDYLASSEHHGNTGHGHVHPRPDGVKARCGGPGLCSECSREQAQQ